MCTALRQERDVATDKRKELWRKEQQLGDALKSTASELEKAQRTLQHTMSRAQWEAVVAVKRIAHEKGIQVRSAATSPPPPPPSVHRATSCAPLRAPAPRATPACSRCAARPARAGPVRP